MIMQVMKRLTKPPTDPYLHTHKSFKNKSGWKPSPPKKTLDTFKRAFKMSLLECKISPRSKNDLTKQQWQGLKELGDNPEIVVKKADKGSAIVIMKTTDYLREGYSQLSDSNFYTKLTHDPHLG